MRLGQLARKYEVTVQDITKYLAKANALPHSLHPNAKVEADIEALVSKHFELPKEVDDTSEKIKGEPKPELIQNIAIEVPKEEKIVLEYEPKKKQKKEVTKVKEEKPIQTVVPTMVETVTIDSDKLLEMLEADEISEDVKRVTLIKAPKKELRSLKIVGKIDLPEPKPKVKPTSIELEPESIKENTTKNQEGLKRTRLTKEEKDEKRLKAKKEREQKAARDEKRRQEAERRHEKLMREAHYKKKLKSNTKTNQTKKKIVAEEVEPAPALPRPRTWLGRFLRWLNT